MQANKNAAQDLRAQLKAGQQPGTSGQSGNGNANPRKRPADDGMIWIIMLIFDTAI